MCATGAQKQVQAQDLATMQEYDQMMQKQYANQQDIYNMVNGVLQPILKAGPSQEGFSAAEKANLNATAVEGTAENYAGAAKAVNEQLAAEGGGNTAITSGAAAQLKAGVAQSAAEQQSKQESQIEEADYATGRQNFLNAEQGEMAVAAGENPLGYAGALNQSHEIAGNEANAIQQADTGWESAVIGAAGSIGATWAAKSGK